ncbi:hypothetical protein [Propionivibrio limicola]|uniref:hypothetical protein n=1 Tax=Propionivibrio limicola TaxID=167645 RepID=UPI001291F926|nr:hypothetical protein [Propionivibrio limicola]
MRKVVCLLFLCLLHLLAFAADPPADVPRSVPVHLFWSKQCPHCLDARPPILDLAKRYPWIELYDYELSEYPENVRRFVELAEQVGQKAQAVPSLIYCGTMETGFDATPAGVSAFVARLERCRKQGSEDNVARQSIDGFKLPLLGAIDPARLSLPLLTILLATLDAFNPCAFFVLLFLLSLLVHQQNGRRMLVIGGIFVAFSGGMYFAFMAAWLNLFLLLGSLPWVTAVAGLLALVMGAINIKDFMRFHEGVTLSISAEGRADVFQRARRILGAGSLPAMIVTTIVLAVAANFYELLCTAGLPMLFTRLLTLQESSATPHYLYLALYNVVYILPLMAIVLAFVRTMGARKLSEREGRLLKLLSGLMMAGLGALLLLAPGMLGNVGVTLAVPALAIGATWLAARSTRS